MADGPRRADAAAIDALIETIVRDAKLPSARERDALRRELADHFEDAGEGALDRFGSTESVAGGLRHAYRRGRRLLYAMKVLASSAAGIGVALAIQLVVNLDVSHGAIGLTHWFVMAIPVAISVVLVAVAAWELDIEPLSVRLERAPARIVAIVLALFAVIFVSHGLSDTVVSPTHALLGAAAIVGSWIAAVAILSRSDRLFLRLLGGTC